nr:hemagglutinin repeat-containing protein [uncultured Noviherbaspirillum sp.]
MNRAFRLIWSAARGACVVAPEAARGCGSTICAAVGLCTTLALAGQVRAQSPPATVVPAQATVSAVTAPNGVPVVNINNPNGAGLSRNQYSRYDVDQRGLVLNNSLPAGLRQSQLAGGVMGNPNLGAEARVILNEVVSSNRSTLAGFTEVLGGKADVIVANPYGITCSGCGFINSDRITLTTGVPAFGVDGGIAGFNVSRGDVLINGGGLNASAQQVLDIVTRSASIDGQVNTAAGGSLGIVTGNNQWRYASRDVAGATTPDGAAPALAIDSSALGGMYAGRIRLIATEAGVGVRMLGDAAASVDDFRLDGAGQVALQGRISAVRDLQVRQTGDAGAASLALSGAAAALSSGRDLTLSSEGGITLDEGMLRAGAGLSLRAKSLTDRSVASASRSAGTLLDVRIDAHAGIDGSRWGAGGTLAMQAGSLAVGALGTGFYSGEDGNAAARGMRLASNGDMTLDRATLVSGGDLALAAQGGALTTGAGVDAESAAGMALTARTALDNSGRLLSARQLTIDATDPATVLAVTNRGLMQAATTLAVGGAGMPVMLANAAAARMLAGNVAFNGTGLDNAGLIQGSNGLSVRTPGAVVNQAGGTLLNAGKGSDLVIAAGSLDNAGTLQSAGGMDLAVGATLANSGTIETTAAADGGSDGLLALRAGNVDNSGTLASAGAAVLTVTDRLDNSGLLQAQSMAVDAGTAIANQGAASRMLAALDLSMGSNGAARLDNAGTIQAGGMLRIGQEGSRMGEVVNDAGAEMLGNSLSLAARNLDNAGLVQAAAGMDLQVRNQLRNRVGGRLLQADAQAALQLQAGSLVNDGGMQSAGSLTARSAAGIDNSGLLQAAGTLDVGASTALRNLGQDSRMLSTGANLVLGATTLDNAGRLQAAHSLSASIAGTLFNNGTILNDSGTGLLMLTVGALDNRGLIQADGAAQLGATTGKLQNSGSIAAGTTLDMSAASGLENNGAGSRLLATGAMTILGGADVTNQGRMQAGSALNVGSTARRAGKLVNRAGAVMVGDSLALYAGSIANSGSIGAQNAAVLDAGRLDNLGKDAAIVVGNGRIDLTGSLRNEGVMHGAEALDVQAAGIVNTGTAGLSSAGDLTVTARTAGITNDGAFYAGKAMTLTAPGQDIVNGDMATMDANDIELDATAFINSGAVEAKQDIAIKTTSAFSNRAVGNIPHIGSVIETSPRTVVFQSETPCDITTFFCAAGYTLTKVYETTQTITESLDAPLPARKGQIIAGRFLDIDYGRNGSNIAALLSAQKLRIHSSDAQPDAFVNQDLHLDKYLLSWRWKETYFVPDVVNGAGTYSYAYPTSASDYASRNGDNFSRVTGNGGEAQENAYRLEAGRATIQTFDAGIYATILDVQGGALRNLGSPFKPAVDAIGARTPGREAIVLQPGAGGVPIVPASGAAVTPVGPAARPQPFQGLNLGLPANPNGFFIPARDPAARYLIETNPLFVNGPATVPPGLQPGSDTLARQLGLDPELLQKRLGDASYEARLIRDQIVAQTGSQFLQGQANEAAQFQALMQQAAAQSAPLGLRFGKGLTADQIARLEQDLVWMVEEDVGGTSVLVPVVYLARSTRQAVIRGAVIEALDLHLQTATLENTGGTIRGGKVGIATAGDVRNTSGAIEGRSVTVASATGSVINETTTDTSARGMVDSTIGKRAVIASQGELSVSAAKDVTVSGATLAAGGDASIDAGRNVALDSVSQLEGGTGYAAGGAVQVRTASQVGSVLEAGGALAVRSGADLLVRSSSVQSGKDMSLDADRSISVVSAQDTTSVESVRIASGAGIGGGVHGTSIASTEQVASRNAASSVASGGSLAASTDGQLLVRGSSLKAQGDVQLEADTVRIEAGRNLDARVSRTDTSTYLKLSSEGKTAATANAKAASDSASETSDKRGTQVDGREVASTTTTSKRSAGASTEIETGKVLAPDPERKAADTNVSTSANSQQRSATVDDRGNRIVSAVDTQAAETARKTDDGLQNMRAASSSSRKEDSVVTTGKAITGAGSMNTDLAAEGSAAASASAGASAEANGKAGVALVENTSVVERKESQQAVASSIASGGNLSIGGRRQVRLEGAKLEAAGDAVIAGDRVDILATQDTQTASTTSRTTSAGFMVDSKNKAEAGASGKASAEGKGTLATGGTPGTPGPGATDKSGSAMPGKVTAEVKGSADASGDASAKANSQSNIDFVRNQKSEVTSNETRNQGSAIKAGGELRISAGDKLRAESANLQGEQQVVLEAKTMEFVATQDLKESSSSTSTTSGGLYADGLAKAEAKGSAAVKGEVRSSLGDQGALNQDSAHAGASASLNAEGSATANAKGGAGLQFKHETAQEQQSASTANVTTIRSGAGDIIRNADDRIVDVGTKIDAAGNVSQEAKTIVSEAASNTSSSSAKTQSDSGKLGVYARADAEASGTLQLSGGAGAGYTGNTLDSENRNKTVLEANAGAGIEAEYAHKDSSKSASASTAVVSTITAGGRLASKSTDATTLEGTRMTGRDIDLQAGSLDMNAAKNTSQSSGQETEGGGKISGGVNAGTGSPVTGALSGSFDRTTTSAASSDAVVGGIQAGRNVSIRTGGDARIEGASIEAGGDASLDVGGKLAIAAAQSTRSTSEEKISGTLALSASKSDTGSGKGMALEGAYARKTEAGSKASVGGISAGGNLALDTGGDARLEGTRLKAGGDADVNVRGDLKFDAARDTSLSESLGAAGSLNLGAASQKDAEKQKQTDVGKAGFSAEGQYEKSASDKAVTGGVGAGGNVRMRAGGDAVLEGTEVRAGNAASVSAGRDLKLNAATDTAETMKFSGEIGLGASSKTVSTMGKDGATTPDNTTDKRKGALDLSGDYALSESRRGAAVQAGAGGAQLAAGKDLSMQGGSVKSGGDVALTAAGDLRLDTATSTSSSLGGSLSAAQLSRRNTVDTDKDVSGGKKGAGIRGGIDEKNQGTAITSGGQAVLRSGGTTSMTNTESTARQSVVTDAKKGVRTATVKDRSEVLNLGVSTKNSSTGAPLATGKGAGSATVKPSGAGSPAKPSDAGTGAAGASATGAPQANAKAGAKVSGPVIGAARADAKGGKTPPAKAAWKATSKKPVKPIKPAGPVIGETRKAAGQAGPAASLP